MVGIAILAVAIATFLASSKGWFKRTIPVRFGFLKDDKIVDDLKISTGDPAKKIVIGFKNTANTTLTALIMETRFIRPLALSATPQAVVGIINKIQHGRVNDRYYMIRHHDIDIPGKVRLDFPVELDTKGITPGSYKIEVTVYSMQQDYKFKEGELNINMT